MTDREKEAFIGGIEFARDWNLDIPPDDLRLYERLIQERTKKRMNKVILTVDNTSEKLNISSFSEVLSTKLIMIV